MTVIITRFTKSKGILTKKISLNKDGTVHKDSSECRMSNGYGQRVQVDGIVGLAAEIATVKSNQAITLGPMLKHLPDKVRVTVKSKLNGSTAHDVIARSRTFIEYAQNQRSFMLLDHDAGDMPDEVADKVQAAGGFWVALVGAAPALRGVGRVERRSTSAG
jgi:hypothetical protein